MTNVRAEGKAELLGQIILQCSGGTAGAPVNANISVSLNTNLTSKVTNGSLETLLFVDDPPVGSRVLGTNLFQATQTSGHAITFSGVQFNAPGASGTRTLRIVNLRGDASMIGAGSAITPSQIFAYISAAYSAGGAIPIWNPSVTVSSVVKGLYGSAEFPSGTPGFPMCQGQNTALVNSTSAAADSLSLILNFREQQGHAFKLRTQPVSGQAPDPLNPTAQPALDVSYQTESGVYDPTLPATNGLNTAGLAAHGTRLRATFTNLPPGVSVYVTTANLQSVFDFYDGSAPSTAVASLISTDANGGGDYAPVAATSSVTWAGKSFGLAQIQVDGQSSASATWEINGVDNVFQYSDVDLPFGVVFVYSPLNAVPETASVSLGFGPVDSGSSATDLPTPRFLHRQREHRRCAHRNRDDW